MILTSELGVFNHFSPMSASLYKFFKNNINKKNYSLQKTRLRAQRNMELMRELNPKTLKRSSNLISALTANNTPKNKSTQC